MGKRKRLQYVSTGEITVIPLSLSFFVQGIPKAQPRGRTFFHPKLKKPVTISTPSNHPVNAWRDALAMALHVHRPPEPWAGPVRLDLLFLMPRPKDHFKTKNKMATTELKPRAAGFHLTVPDRDNMDKPILDEMKVGGYFTDDSQVCWGGPIGKVYHPEGKPTGCLVRVTFMEDTPQVLGGLLSQFADELRGI